METLQNQQNNPSVIRTVRLPLTSHLKLQDRQLLLAASKNKMLTTNRLFLLLQ